MTDITAERPLDTCELPGLEDLCLGVTGAGSQPPADAADGDGQAPPQEAAPPGTGEWAIVESPNVSSEPNVLTAVTCPTPSDCWAVGRASDGLGSTVTMSWDGSSWVTVPSPNIEDARANILSDVTCVTPSDCWAVGAYVTEGLQVRTLILQWDGVSWEIVNSPDIGVDPWNGLNSVECISASECWAVGFNTTTGTAKTLILKWDGTKWDVHDSPNASTKGNVLHGVTCLSGSDCWAVGSYTGDDATKHTLTMRWDGNVWEVVGSADNDAAQENVLSGVTCVSDSDCWAVGHSFTGSARQTLIERWDGAAWTIVGSPNAIGPIDTYLSSVECASATECWAVGYSNDTVTIDQHFIARWNGVLWTPATLPDPVGTQASVLHDVACLSASDCWSVGSFTAGTNRSLLNRWDGTTWESVPPPRVSLEEQSHGYLHDVTCVDASDCWSVGFYFFGQVARSLIMHWDGESWDVVESPNVGLDRNNYLDSITCTSTSNCWVVGRHTTTLGVAGQTLILRWDGEAWSIVPSFPADTSAAQSNALTGVSCSSESECVAVGFSSIEGGRYQALALHWDGTSWLPGLVRLREDAETFYVPSDILYDVSCPAPSECLAVGAHWTGTVYQTLVDHWDGTTWTPVTSPNTAPDRGNILSSVTCVSASDCWAVGSADDYEQGLIEHWDGTSWSIVDSPQTGNILSAVSCLSATECWAAGPYYTPHPPAKTLLVRWDGGSWSKFSTPNASATQSNNLAGIACASSSDCWAVGQYFVPGRTQTLTLRYGPKREDPLPEASSLAFTESCATAGQYSDETRFEARLTDSVGDPLSGAPLTFTLIGEGLSREFTGTTDADGIAGIDPALVDRPGSYELTVRFAGDAGYLESATSRVFLVQKEDTVVDLRVLGQGSNRSLSARLSDLDSPADGLAGRTISFYANSELIGSAVTDANGVAQIAIPAGHRGAKRTFGAAFAGDDFFLPSAD
ncbi:MAG TPA: carboxypeptidase-like regulatory domain-containing protein [Actinomycetota bacterium]|nr:carboxypeptidase-like regulatory domain-containing protein [Actinomycetota bacterium]